MFWRVIVCILVGLFVISFGLPVLGLIAELIHRYLSRSTSSASESFDAKPED